MYIFITILILLASILMILAVLVQKSKGGGLASGFSSSGDTLIVSYVITCAVTNRGNSISRRKQYFFILRLFYDGRGLLCSGSLRIFLPSY